MKRVISRLNQLGNIEASQWMKDVVAVSIEVRQVNLAVPMWPQRLILNLHFSFAY